MRTDIKNIRDAVVDLMDHTYVDGVAVDYTTTIIDANPPEPADASVALYMGDDERTWDVVAQRWRDGAPAVWLSFAILTDEPGCGTIGVFSHDAADGYADVVDYIEIDTRGAADETASLMVESDQLYTGLRGATLDYIRRVMLDGKAA